MKRGRIKLAMKKEFILEEEINLIENTSLLSKLTAWSAGLALSSMIILEFILKRNHLLYVETNKLKFILDFFLVCGLFVLSLVIHEGIHGFFFKWFGGKKVTYGFKAGMIYAASFNSFYTRFQYSVIAAAPFIVLSSLYFILGKAHPIIASLLFSMHTAGCVGDFYYLYILLKKGKGVFVKDTETGMSIYRKKENGVSESK